LGTGLCLPVRGDAKLADVDIDRRDAVTWITLNRADRMNAYDATMAQSLIEAVRSASDSGVIVITGSGRAFCAGGYLASLREPKEADLRNLFHTSLKVFEEIRASPNLSLPR
jgi:2-ketocyclohexanecarboxyl-CoA hydrolase